MDTLVEESPFLDFSELELYHKFIEDFPFHFYTLRTYSLNHFERKEWFFISLRKYKHFKIKIQLNIQVIK